MPQVREPHICGRCELECDCGRTIDDCPHCSLCNEEIEDEYGDYETNTDAGDEDDYPNDEWGV